MPHVVYFVQSGTTMSPTSKKMCTGNAGRLLELGDQLLVLSMCAITINHLGGFPVLEKNK